MHRLEANLVNVRLIISFVIVSIVLHKQPSKGSRSAIFLFTRNGRFDLARLQAPIYFIQRHIVQIPMITDIISVPGMVFVGRVGLSPIEILE
jgi:hypothetical protein